MEIKDNKFYILGGREKIPLNKGVELSVINCFGSYSDNHFNTRLFCEEGNIESDTVEIALVKDGKFITKDYFDRECDVIGYITAQELEKIIQQLKEVI